MVAVLVVEDYEDLRETLVMLFEALGFQACAACNGEEALQRIGCHRPDVVVADCDMPVMGGVALGRTIRSWPPEQRIPVLLMSAGYSKGQVPRDAYDAFIEKPAKAADLVAKIAELVATSSR